MTPERTLRREVVCPFCGLACDDLAIERDGERLRLREGGCGRSREHFERPLQPAGPRIAGQPTDLSAAIARAADLLRGSRLPLFAGLGADVDGVRAAMRLADRLGGVVDHLGADALFRNLRVVQDAGWVVTTLGEVRNHMDLLLVIGPDPNADYPRFVERCVRPDRTLYLDKPPERPVIRIGPPSAAEAEGLGAETVLPCAVDRLPEVAAALRALVNGGGLAASEIAAIPADRLRDVAQRLRAARYGVVAWAAAHFDFTAAELTVQTLAAMVQDLNRTTRCSLLPLTGNDNLIGANQVCLWQCGSPLRTGFGRGVPAHDPHLLSARRLLDTGEADALVWISAFRAVTPPAASGVPTVVLATPDTALEPPPEVFIPVGTPGLDHAGQFFRMDTVVSLPLSALRESGLPSVAGVLRQIEQAIPAVRSRPE